MVTWMYRRISRFLIGKEKENRTHQSFFLFYDLRMDAKVPFGNNMEIDKKNT